MTAPRARVGHDADDLDVEEALALVKDSGDRSPREPGSGRRSQDPQDLDVEEALALVRDANARDPHGNARDPHGNARDPHGNARDPHGNARDPHGNARDPHGNARDPHGNARDPHADASDPHDPHGVSVPAPSPREAHPGHPAHPAKPGHHKATPWPEARTTAERAARSVPRRAPVSVTLDAALGLVLAAPLAALTDLPSFDTSAMDGWAVAGPGPWDVREEGALAGQAQPRPLTDGEAMRIATGARIPQDTTAVLRSEHGQTDGRGRLHATRDLAHGQDIRPRGQECRSGDHLLPTATVVTPAVLGLAAAAGYDTVSVVPRPRAEVLVLGDELLTEGLPHDGLIRDALGPMLPPWLRALGAEVVAVRRLGDDAEALHRAITGSGADLIVTTGGTAAGPVDHVHPILARIGAELLVDGVKVRPGHPMLLARTKEDQHLVGLPGNPLAAVSGLLTLAEPLLRTLAGRRAPESYTLPLTSEVHGHPYDTRLIPVVLSADAAAPLHYNGPAMLRGIAAADALAVVPPGGARPGQELELLDLPWAMGGMGECFT